MELVIVSRGTSLCVLSLLSRQYSSTWRNPWLWSCHV